MLMPALPIPVNFVSKRLAEFDDCGAELPDIDTADFPERLIQPGCNGWTVQTYLHLRKRYTGVFASSQFVHDAINVAHYDTITPDIALSRYFIVSIRADRDPTFVANLEICQNQSSLTKPYMYFMPFWPQPGLLQRDPARGNLLQRLVYMGTSRNLADRFKAERFRSNLANYGVEFSIEESSWADYRNIDAVLAVRDGQQRFLAGKPASKLTNAWHAGCPALLGDEPAYREIGRPGFDYIQVSGPNDVIAAIYKLRNDPEYYNYIVRNGKAKASKFTVEALCVRWYEFLSGPASEEYLGWHKSLSSKPIMRWINFGYRLARRKLWGYQYYEGYKNGNPMPTSTLGQLRRTLFKP